MGLSCKTQMYPTLPLTGKTSTLHLQQISSAGKFTNSKLKTSYHVPKRGGLAQEFAATHAMEESQLHRSRRSGCRRLRNPMQLFIRPLCLSLFSLPAASSLLLRRHFDTNPVNELGTKQPRVLYKSRSKGRVGSCFLNDMSNIGTSSKHQHRETLT